jgi:hypothetical protein
MLEASGIVEPRGILRGESEELAQYRRIVRTTVARRVGYGIALSWVVELVVGCSPRRVARLWHIFDFVLHHSDHPAIGPALRVAILGPVFYRFP